MREKATFEDKNDKEFTTMLETPAHLSERVLPTDDLIFCLCVLHSRDLTRDLWVLL